MKKLILMALAILMTTAAARPKGTLALARMAQKVVIISSSPRQGGNTELLCDEFRRGAEKVGATVEKVNLNDYRIDFITACTDGSDITAQCAIDAFQGFTMCLPKAEVKGMVKAPQ